MSEYKRPKQDAARQSAVYKSNSAAHKTASSAAARKRALAAKKAKQRKARIKMVAFIAIIAVAAILGVYLVTQHPFDKKGNNSADPTPAPTQYAMSDLFSGTTVDLGNDTDGLDSNLGYSVKVTDLKLTQGLSDEWMNILLLGTDARQLNAPCRTDSMIICSVNKKSGQVKLASIMRDTAIEIEGHDISRINAAYFYGGANLAMQAVNEYFGMNIEKYVLVDFSGFASIAEELGGIECDITEPEVFHINANVAEHYLLLVNQGSMKYEDALAEFDAQMIRSAGRNTHLNGMQTLGYARIRKIDSDYERSNRQRTVLIALLNKAKSSITSLDKIMRLVTGNMKYVKTNLDLNDIINLAGIVLGSDISTVEQLRLPENGTYAQETRQGQAMLFDMDVTKNTFLLHNFIYG